jgi:hypothetical protein
MGAVCPSLPFNVRQQIMYDGYLDMTMDETGRHVLTDTLIVLTNTNKVNKNLHAWIEVFDKDGIKRGQGKLYNGGQEITTIGSKAFGWITLGMLVDRATHNPFGSPGGEKFVIKISTDVGGQWKGGVAPVEVKQVTFKTRQENPGEAIWNAADIATWSETTLGGKLTPGLVYYPVNLWP